MAGEDLFGERLVARLLSSNAMENPVMVTSNAAVFKYHGIVMIWTVIHKAGIQKGRECIQQYSTWLA